MGLFDKLFGNKQQKDTSGPMPTRGLNLQQDITPANGIAFANQYKDAVMGIENIHLDFSVESLNFVDSFLQRFRDEGMTVNDFAETIFTAGCYVGQVMVHNNAGVWINEDEAGLPNGISMMPIVIKLPDGTITDPIAKSYKRFYNGAGDGIPYYYSVSVSEKKP